MNLLHIAGGFAQHPLYSQLIQHLRALDFQQTVLAPVRSAEEKSRQPPDVPGSLDYKFRHVLNPAHRLLFRTKTRAIYRDMLECVDPSQYELVHAHTLYSDGAVALQLHKKFGTPFLVAVRNTDLNLFMRVRPDLRWVMHSVVSAASRVVFLSPAYQAEFLDRLDEDLRVKVKQKSILLSNGLESSWLQPHRRSIRDPNVPLRILYVGDFSKNKNVESLMRATALLNGRTPLQLTLVGDGGDREAHIRNAVAHGEYPFVNFIGRVNDRAYLQSVYRSNDIFVMPSLKETFGVVYVEALSQGLPIVHSRGQGVDGYFSPGIVSEAVNPKSIDGIARGIELLADRLEQVRSICIAEAQQFSWESIALSYDKMYRAIASG